MWICVAMMGRKGDVNHLLDDGMDWEVSSKRVEGENEQSLPVDTILWLANEIKPGISFLLQTPTCHDHKKTKSEI